MARYASGEETKQALLEAAGELFAENGLNGTSVRDIVKKAGATLSSVNYYFESKENLYIECVKYIALEKINFNRMFSEVISPEPETPQALTNAIYGLIRDVFWTSLSPERPEWYGKLIARAMLDLGRNEQSIFAELIPFTEMENLLLRCGAGIDREQARLWIISLLGSANQYMLARVTILSRFDKEGYDEELIEKIIGFYTSSTIHMLNLPEPEKTL